MNINNSRRGWLLLFVAIFSCASLLITNPTAVKVIAQQDSAERCVPLPFAPDAPSAHTDADECTRPGTTQLATAWPQNANVTVRINASQFTQAEYDCMKSVFESFDAARVENAQMFVSMSHTAIHRWLTSLHPTHREAPMLL